MSIIGNNILAGASGNQGYEIARSLRFNDDDSAYLSRTFGSGSNRKTWSLSTWVKRAGLGTAQNFTLEANSGNGFNRTYLYFDTSDRIDFMNYSSSATTRILTTRKFRDTSAWYHILLVFDSTDATSSDRIKLYVNGERETAFDSTTYPSLDYDGYMGTDTYEHTIGYIGYSGQRYFDGYLAEIHYVNGTALAASDFGETDSDTGAWIPKKYSGSYGTNGFYLNFSDNSGVTATTLGKDSSGNGNNFTPNNFSVTAGAGNDSLEDTPTNNWCTLNPLNTDNVSTFSNGNLDTVCNNASTSGGSIAVNSGKWYAEVVCTAKTASNAMVGICTIDGFDGERQVDESQNGGSGHGYVMNATKLPGGASYGATWAIDDVIGIALDLDSAQNTVTFYKNGTSQGAINISNAAYVFACSNGQGSSTVTYTYNFGQRAFDYTPPTGFKALNTANLPVPTVKDGTEYFNTVLFTGNGSTQSITGVGFQPDWTWIKMRSDGSRGHALFDAVRGGTERLDSSATQEGRTNEGNISFQTDGFNVTSTHPTVNDSSDTAVAWNWKAGGSGSANTDGTISSTVSVNADAGFSIVSYTGSGANATIGHGLGVAPSMVIVKNRDAATDWSVWAEPITDQYGAAYAIFLQGTSGAGSYSGVFNSTAPTSTVFSVGTSSSTNTSSQDYIAYCFAEVEGYSKIGSYTGNGSSDGPFVECGLRPAFLMIKRIDTTGEWWMYDNARGPINVIPRMLMANSTSAEQEDSASYLIDFLSNGFKWRSGLAASNGSGGSFIFMAFAETPFKYANAA